MGTPYVGEIRMFAGNFAPVGWAFCQGQTLAIAENTTLFQLIGTTYGGDGQQTFNLPNLSSRVPVHNGSQGGSTFTLGQMGGQETVTLTTAQLPSHSHPAGASSGSGTSNSPANTVWANSTQGQYTDQGQNTQMSVSAIGNAGSSQPHDNMIPYVTINFIISLFGVFPTQN